MKTLTDKNGLLINLMDSVVMPDPRKGDCWAHGNFCATVIDQRGENLIVEDMDSDCFEIEAHRVTLAN